MTPEHVVPQVLEALALAIERGLTLPIVYNTSAYDKERHRQVGPLGIDSAGLAKHVLLIRYLVMPGMLEDTRRILE